ncbi:hypothetical protein ACOBQX_27080 [Actinokineospora sp. G85]|uniref:hypothetical protein n=1 Tax=Actinokineospora sp. G85 TaxID=3406626 RepID=UPI003C7580B8
MSTPGGPYWQEPQPQYQVDPVTGQPAPYQQGHPQGDQQYQQSYQGFGMYQQPPPGPPKSNRTPWIVVAVVVLVAAIGGVATLLWINKDGDEPAAAPGPSSSQQAPETTSSSRKSTSRPTTSARPSTPSNVEDILVESVVTGWQGVLSYKEGVAYDVPKDWKVATPDTIVGFADNEGKPTAVMHGVTTYKPDACTAVKGSNRGNAGFVTAGQTEIERAAVNGVKLFAEAASLNPDNTKAPVQLSEPSPTKVAAGKVDAVTATAVMTVDQPGECPSPTVKFTSVAFKNGENTMLFMLYHDQGTPDALPDDVVTKIIQSIRPYEG